MDQLQNQDVLVSEVIHSNGLEIEFSRQLVWFYHKEWCELLQLCHNFKLHDHDNQILWRWSESGKYTVHSMYVCMEFGGVPNNNFVSIWHANIPKTAELSFG